MESEVTPEKVRPAFFDLLTESDKEKYDVLREELSSTDRKFKRYKRITSLQDALAAIQEYCSRGDKDDWKRALVCGVCWMGGDIAINTRQLRLLINKCKSSINGALAKMGFSSVPIKGDSSSQLVQAIPFLKGNFLEQRMWTVRRRQFGSPAPIGAYQIFSPYGAIANYISPQPYYPQAPYTPKYNSEITAMFGVKKENDTYVVEETPKSPIKECNFDDLSDIISDPCCCCPLEWMNEKEEIDEMFSFG